MDKDLLPNTTKHTLCIVTPFTRLPRVIQEQLPSLKIVNFPLSGVVHMPPNMDKLIDVVKESEADIILTWPHIVVKLLQSGKCTNIKWFQGCSAGAEVLFKAFSEQPQNVIFTRTGEGFGEYMSEYVLGQIISREHFFPKMLESQRAKRWERTWYVQKRSLSMLTIGLLGTGVIGSKIAEVCKAFGMMVWGLSRTKKEASIPHFDVLMEKSEISKFLAGCDYVCSVLPSTTDTIGMLSGNILQACQEKKSVFINIGRGDVIDESSLLNALNNGWIGGAIMDTTDREPLPPESELWSHPNIVITPHISGPCSTDVIAKVFVSNYNKYINGEPLDYLLDFERGY
ncbi:glyoxylate/hydroxypyruvate reductase A-like isoform X1 [Saccostrea cucullata]|uniref:glyoxylate/hydroxypyruvate reductase A-like isoform X1 n=1 Tax=Saccostrea cuccullata TaxID=36930 RepID=UPI002ED52758